MKRINKGSDNTSTVTFLSAYELDVSAHDRHYAYFSCTFCSISTFYEQDS